MSKNGFLVNKYNWVDFAVKLDTKTLQTKHGNILKLPFWYLLLTLKSRMLTVRHIRFRPGRFLSSAKQLTNQRTAFDSAANKKRMAYLWRGCRWSVWLSSQQWRSDWVWSWQQTQALLFDDQKPEDFRWWEMMIILWPVTCLIIMLQLSNILS